MMLDRNRITANDIREYLLLSESDRNKKISEAKTLLKMREDAVKSGKKWDKIDVEIENLRSTITELEKAINQASIFRKEEGDKKVDAFLSMSELMKEVSIKELIKNNEDRINFLNNVLEKKPPTKTKIEIIKLLDNIKKSSKKEEEIFIPETKEDLEKYLSSYYDLNAIWKKGQNASPLERQYLKERIHDTIQELLKKKVMGKQFGITEESKEKANLQIGFTEESFELDNLYKIIDKHFKFDKCPNVLHQKQVYSDILNAHFSDYANSLNSEIEKKFTKELFAVLNPKTNKDEFNDQFADLLVEVFNDILSNREVDLISWNTADVGNILKEKIEKDGKIYGFPLNPMIWAQNKIRNAIIKDFERKKWNSIWEDMKEQFSDSSTPDNSKYKCVFNNFGQYFLHDHDNQILWDLDSKGEELIGKPYGFENFSNPFKSKQNFIDSNDGKGKLLKYTQVEMIRRNENKNYSTVSDDILNKMRNISARILMERYASAYSKKGKKLSAARTSMKDIKKAVREIKSESKSKVELRTKPEAESEDKSESESFYKDYYDILDISGSEAESPLIISPRSSVITERFDFKSKKFYENIEENIEKGLGSAVTYYAGKYNNDDINFIIGLKAKNKLNDLLSDYIDKKKKVTDISWEGDREDISDIDREIISKSRMFLLNDDSPKIKNHVWEQISPVIDELAIYSKSLASNFCTPRREKYDVKYRGNFKRGEAKIKENHFNFQINLCSVDDPKSRRVETAPLFSPWVASNADSLKERNFLNEKIYDFATGKVSKEDILKEIKNPSINLASKKDPTIGKYGEKISQELSEAEKIYQADGVPLVFRVLTGDRVFMNMLSLPLENEVFNNSITYKSSEYIRTKEALQRIPLYRDNIVENTLLLNDNVIKDGMELKSSDFTEKYKREQNLSKTNAFMVCVAQNFSNIISKEKDMKINGISVFPVAIHTIENKDIYNKKVTFGIDWVATGDYSVPSKHIGVIFNYKRDKKMNDLSEFLTKSLEIESEIFEKCKSKM